MKKRVEIWRVKKRNIYITIEGKVLFSKNWRQGIKLFKQIMIIAVLLNNTKNH